MIWDKIKDSIRKKMKKHGIPQKLMTFITAKRRYAA